MFCTGCLLHWNIFDRFASLRGELEASAREERAASSKTRASAELENRCVWLEQYVHWVSAALRELLFFCRTHRHHHHYYTQPQVWHKPFKLLLKPASSNMCPLHNIHWRVETWALFINNSHTCGKLMFSSHPVSHFHCVCVSCFTVTRSGVSRRASAAMRRWAESHRCKQNTFTELVQMFDPSAGVAWRRVEM